MENFWEMFKQELRKDGDHLVKGLITKEIGRWHDVSTLSKEIAQLCNRTIEFINELAAAEIQYLKDKKWTRWKQAKFEENYHKQKYSIWQSLRRIETEVYMSILRLPEPESHRKARESFQTICDIISTRIELWLTIPDDAVDTFSHPNIQLPKS